MTAQTNQWKVTAYTGKNRDIVLGHGYVRAVTESQAVELGKRALRLIGIGGRYQVSARPYSPLADYEFHGYVRAIG
jgi:hypothetical protein